MWMVHTLFLGFVLGALAILGLEVAGVLYLIRRLNRKVKEQETRIAGDLLSPGPIDLDFSFPHKQGFVWVLKEKVTKTWLSEKGPKQQKRMKEILEVSPVKKYAKITDQSLIISELDGSHIEIPLKGCNVSAVSATSLSSRKWAKRYPIKVESKTSVIYHGSHSLHLYLGTSWEKESWCKALRLASCEDKEKIKWFATLRSEFHSYLTLLNIEYPSFMKPSVGFNPELMDKSIKFDGSSSKVRHFLKKFAKKASKSGAENKANWASTSGHEERRISEKSYTVQEIPSGSGPAKPAQTGKLSNHVLEENTVPSVSSAFTHSASSSQSSVNSGTVSFEKITSDEGTLCWNLLISRLFFDAKNNAEIRSSLQARIQRTLSNMRIPNYIGEITCTSVDPGNLPPHIHGMRVLPSDMKEVVSLEVDIEYCGGLVLNIATRLEVRELDLSENADTNLETSSVENVTEDLLEGFEYLENQLKLSEGTADGVEQKGHENSKLDKLKSFKSTVQASPNVSKWKSILNSVAKQVSQVPLSLSIRVAALRGTLRLHVKPPPSDQIWFGFTSIPDIDFNLESSVGDHKITSGHIALFLISRFKAAVRETMVLPNSESVSIPWMLAEKDDWIPQKLAPFMWINQEAVTDPTNVHQVPSSQPSEEETRVREAVDSHTSSYPEGKLANKKKEVSSVLEAVKINTSSYPEVKEAKEKKELTSELLDQRGSAYSPMNQLTLNENPLQELRSPLLENDEQQQLTSQWIKEGNRDGQSAVSQSPSLSRSLILPEEQSDTVEGNDAKPKRIGTRARMLGLGKKVGEKLEEKRRNIEERSRSMVDRMRGP